MDITEEKKIKKGKMKGANRMNKRVRGAIKRAFVLLLTLVMLTTDSAIAPNVRAEEPEETSGGIIRLEYYEGNEVYYASGNNIGKIIPLWECSSVLDGSNPEEYGNAGKLTATYRGLRERDNDIIYIDVAKGHKCIWFNAISAETECVLPFEEEYYGFRSIYCVDISELEEGIDYTIYVGTEAQTSEINVSYKAGSGVTIANENSDSEVAPIWDIAKISNESGVSYDAVECGSTSDGIHFNATFQNVIVDATTRLDITCDINQRIAKCTVNTENGLEELPINQIRDGGKNIYRVNLSWLPSGVHFLEIETEDVDVSPVSVSAKWDNNTGIVNYDINGDLVSDQYELRIYRNDKVIGKFQNRFEDLSIGYQSEFGFFSQYFTESGIYRASILIDGIEYSTEEWVFTRPKEIGQDPIDVSWSVDEEGRPTGISWTTREDIGENAYYQIILKALDGSLYEEYEEDVWKENGRFVSSFGSDVSESFVEGKAYQVSVVEVPYDITEKRRSNAAYATYVWGEAENIPVGPKNILVDAYSGVIEFVDGDAAESDELKYNFELYREGKKIANCSIVPTEVGKREELTYFATFVENINVEIAKYVLQVNATWKTPEGQEMVLHGESIPFLYEGGGEPIDAPGNVRIEDNCLVWDAVDGAASYVVMAQYNYNGAEKTYTTIDAGNSFDFSSMLNDSRMNIYDISFRVRSVSQNMKDMPQSAFVGPIVYHTPVTLNWADERNGDVVFSLSDTLKDRTLELLLYKDNAVISRYSYAVVEDETDDIVCGFASFIQESGNYKVVIKADGREFSTREWRYTRPEVAYAMPSNVRLITDEDGRPDILKWYCEKYDESDFFLISFKELGGKEERGLITEVPAYDNCEYDFCLNAFEEGEDYSFRENETYQISIKRVSNDLAMFCSGMPAYLMYTWGTGAYMPAGPQDLELDVANGCISYIDGDNVDDNEIEYIFELYYNGRVIADYSTTPRAIGAKESVGYFGGQYKGSGDYELATKVAWTNSNGKRVQIYVGDNKCFFHTEPGKYLATPGNILIDDTKLKWNSVADAGSYIVKALFTDEESVEIKYFDTKENSFDFYELLLEEKDSFSKCTFSVQAIPQNLESLKASRFSKTIDFELDKYESSNEVVSINIRYADNEEPRYYIGEYQGMVVPLWRGAYAYDTRYGVTYSDEKKLGAESDEKSDVTFSQLRISENTKLYFVYEDESAYYQVLSFEAHNGSEKIELPFESEKIDNQRMWAVDISQLESGKYDILVSTDVKNADIHLTYKDGKGPRFASGNNVGKVKPLWYGTLLGFDGFKSEEEKSGKNDYSELGVTFKGVNLNDGGNTLLRLTFGDKARYSATNCVARKGDEVITLKPFYLEGKELCLDLSSLSEGEWSIEFVAEEVGGIPYEDIKVEYAAGKELKYYEGDKVGQVVSLWDNTYISVAGGIRKESKEKESGESNDGSSALFENVPISEGARLYFKYVDECSNELTKCVAVRGTQTKELEIKTDMSYLRYVDISGLKESGYTIKVYADAEYVNLKIKYANGTGPKYASGNNLGKVKPLWECVTAGYEYESDEKRNGQGDYNNLDATFTGLNIKSFDMLKVSFGDETKYTVSKCTARKGNVVKTLDYYCYGSSVAIFVSSLTEGDWIIDIEANAVVETTLAFRYAKGAEPRYASGNNLGKIIPLWEKLHLGNIYSEYSSEESVAGDESIPTATYKGVIPDDDAKLVYEFVGQYNIEKCIAHKGNEEIDLPVKAEDCGDGWKRFIIDISSLESGNYDIEVFTDCRYANIKVRYKDGTGPKFSSGNNVGKVKPLWFDSYVFYYDENWGEIQRKSEEAQKGDYRNLNATFKNVALNNETLVVSFGDACKYEVYECVAYNGKEKIEPHWYGTEWGEVYFIFDEDNPLTAGDWTIDIVARDHISTYFKELVGDTSKMIVGDPLTGKRQFRVVDKNGVSATGVQYSTSDSSVAIVDKYGNVTAVGEGTVTISAKVNGYGGEFSVSLVVKNEIYDIDLMDDSDKEFKGSVTEDFLKVCAYPANVDPEGTGLRIPEEYKDIIGWESCGCYEFGLETFRVYLKPNAIISEIVKVPVTAFVKEKYEGTIKEFTAEKIYVIYPNNEIIPDISSYEFESFALADTVLSNVGARAGKALPDGWHWVNPDRKLDIYNATGTHYFKAEYITQYGESVFADVPVTFTVPDSEIFDGISDKYKKDSSSVIDFNGYTKENFDELDIISSNSKILEVVKVDGEEHSFTINAKVKGTVTLNYFVAGGKVSSKKVTVVAGDIIDSEDFAYIFLDGKGNPITEDNYVIEFANQGETFTIVSKVDDYSMNVVSTDTAVIKVTNGSKLLSQNAATIIPVGAGEAYINLVVNDAVKTTKSIYIRVIDKSDKAVVLDKDTLTFDMGKKSVEDALRIFDGGNRAVKSVQLYEAKYFDTKLNPLAGIEKSSNFIVGEPFENVIKVTPSEEGKVVNGKYVLEITLDDGMTVYRRIVIKAVSTKPKFTIKQLNVPDMTKLAENVTRLYISSDKAKCTGVEVVGLADSYYSYDSQEQLLTINNLDNKNKFTINCSSDEYNPVSLNISLKTTASKLSLSSSSGSIYYDLEGAVNRVDVIDSATKKIFEYAWDSADVEIINESSYIAWDSDSGIAIEIKDGVIPKASEKLVIKYSSKYLAKDFVFNYTIKAYSFSKAKLEFGAKSLKLYSYPGQSTMVSTSMSLAGRANYFDAFSSVSIKEKVNPKLGESHNKTLAVEYDENYQRIVVRKISSELVAGKYNYVFTTEIGGKEISATLPIEVVVVKGETAKDSAGVKTTVKNNVDLYNRNYTSIVISPKFTNVPAGADFELVSLGGKDAGLFEIVNNNEIRLKETANILEKETYVVSGVYKVNANGAELELVGNENKIKFKTKKTVVKIIEKMTNVFCMSQDEKTISLQALNGAQKLDVDRVVLTNMKDDFAIDVKGDDVTITYLCGGNCKKGKTYTLKMNVYLKDAASDAVPVTISYKVKVSK